MKKEEIHLSDIKRILIGNAPPEFLLEVLVRSLIVYILALIVVRWMGKRMSGQLTIIEMSVMVMMGAIIAPPVQIPDRGIVPGLLVLFTTLFLLRTVNWISFRKPGFEKKVQGEVKLLVKNGVILPEAQKKSRITNQQLFEELRGKNIYNLGAVKRLYLEACGMFTIYQEEEPKPGLPLYPSTDRDLYNRHPAAPGTGKACTRCGLVQPREAAACPHCGAGQWSKTIV